MVFVVHNKHFPMLPACPAPARREARSCLVLAQFLATATGRWALVRGLAARCTNADLLYFKVPLELLLPFLKEDNERKRDGNNGEQSQSLEKRQAAGRETDLSRKAVSHSQPDPRSPWMSLRPPNFQLPSAPHLHLPPQTQTLFLICSPRPHTASSKLLPLVFSLLLLEKLNLVSPKITDNI